MPRNGGHAFIVEAMGEAQREVLLDSHMVSFNEERSVLHLRRWLLCKEDDPVGHHHETASGPRIMSTRRHARGEELPPEQRALQSLPWRALVQVLKADARAC